VKVLTIVGARPQFIKAAVVSAEFVRRDIDEVLVHTGQHYDYEMSQVFFDDLGMRAPDHFLGVGSGSHGEQTGEMLKRLEDVIERERPDWVLVYGDTNSTLAGALAAAKLGVRVAHVEAGLRSFVRTMPEEINRIVADHLATLHLAPTQAAARQLAREGISEHVAVTGDMMVDLALHTAGELPPRPAILDRFELQSRGYALATIHRAANTDDEATFSSIVEGLRRTQLPVIFPVHPRTRALVRRLGVGSAQDRIVPCEPLPYRDIIALQYHARVVLTDSGGIQKEAYALGTPCVTLRDETEWVETLEAGWNVLAGSDPDAIATLAVRAIPETEPAPHFGDGTTAARVADALLTFAETASQR